LSKILASLLIPAAAALLLVPASTLAQDDGEKPLDIDVGSKRVGGPGTQAQRKADAAYDAAAEEEATPMTEESLPKPGDKKRLPALHKLARQYYGGRMWKDACEKYEMIVSEGGEEALTLTPEGKGNAARSFYECGVIAFNSGDYDKVESWLKKGEREGGSTSKGQLIRHKMLKEQYRRAMANGDVNNAIGMFKKYQAEQTNEDERIWMGEELAKFAWNAYQAKDKMAMDDYIKKAEDIAPMNTELRKLKSKISGEEGVLGNLIMYGGLAVVLVVVGTQLSKWRAKQKVRRASGSGFEDQLEDENL
jgi:hypothetical protein